MRLSDLSVPSPSFVSLSIVFACAWIPSLLLLLACLSSLSILYPVSWWDGPRDRVSWWREGPGGGQEEGGRESFYQERKTRLWPATNKLKNTIKNGESAAGLQSANRVWRLVIENGEAVVRNVGNGKKNSSYRVIWRSHTAGLGGTMLKMESDGNLALYSGKKKVVWSCCRGGRQGASSLVSGVDMDNTRPPYRLELHDDGTLKIRDGGDVVIWDTSKGRSRTKRRTKPPPPYALPSVLVPAARRDICKRYADQFAQNCGTCGMDTLRKRFLTEDGRGVVVNSLRLRGEDPVIRLCDNKGDNCTSLHLRRVLRAVAEVEEWKKRKAAAEAEKRKLRDTIENDQILQSSLRSANRKWWLVIQDGDVVVKKTGKDGASTWRSNTRGLGGTTLKMQSDGNLVLYTAAGNAVWACCRGRSDGASLLVSGVDMNNTRPPYRLKLHNDGTLTIRDGADVLIWDTSKVRARRRKNKNRSG